MNFRPLCSALMCVQLVFAVHVLNADAQPDQADQAAQAEFVAPETHEQIEIRGFQVLLNKELRAAEKSELTDTMFELLDGQLERLENAIPAQPLANLRTVKIWINPPYPGVRPTAQYHGHKKWLKNNGRMVAMAKCVEITNVENFAFENTRMPYLLVHEMAHAYHDQVLGFKNPKVREAFSAAEESGVYDDVDRFDGRKIIRDKAYAMSNSLEYFAESSEAYFGRNDFFPFDRAELLEHDPGMHDLVIELWDVKLKDQDKDQEGEPLSDADPAIESSLHAFVHVLDNILSLSVDQHQTIVDRLRADWNKKRYRRPFNVNITGTEVIKEELALLRKFSEEVLDEQQSLLLEQIEKLPIGLEGALAVRAAEKNDKEELFKQFGMKITDQRIAELTKLCELSDEQVAKFKVARNGVLKELSDEQAEVIDSVEAEKIIFDKRAMYTIAKPLIFRCTESPVWQTALKETLTEEQKAKFTERDATRIAIVKQYASNQAIDHLLIRLLKVDISAEKLAEVEALFLEHIQSRYICDIWRKNGLEEIPKAKLIELVGEKHGERLYQAIAKEAARFDKE